MTTKEQINFWFESAELDLPVAESLFKNKHYVWCLFIGHLVLEKVLKAHYINTTGKTPPKTHDLVKLAQKNQLDLTREQLEYLLKVNSFNLETRYPDYKLSAFKTYNKKYAFENFNKIKELFQWLRSLLK